MLIVINPPRLDLLVRVVQRQEYMRVQAFVEDPAVEASIMAFSTGFRVRISPASRRARQLRQEAPSR